MRIILLKTTLVFIFLFGLFSCHLIKKEKKAPPVVTFDVKPKLKKPKSLVYDQSFDRVASLIAGISQDSSSPLLRIDTLPVFNKYKQDIDSLWKKMDEQRLQKMITWSGEELKEVNESTKTLLYPFSGPDFLNATTFFPDCKNYLLIALEPIGQMPKVEEFNEEQTQIYSTFIKQSLNDLFRRSYFITKNMLTDFQKEKVNGALPIMCFFLKRTNHRIVNIEYIMLDSLGKELPKNDSISLNRAIQGVKISFTQLGKDEIKHLYYFKTDLSNDGLKIKPQFLTFLSGFDSISSYLKSASYLLHYGSFKTMRDFVLDHSFSVLQDDSGISYEFFDKSNWNIQLYGKYAKPISEFSHIKEDDLMVAFQDSSVKPMPFTLGYRWGSQQVNLLKATRK